MKKIASFGAALLVSCAMAFSMTACTPTANNPLQQEAQSQAEAERQTNPDGEIYETVDGAEEKLNMVVTDEPSIMVSVYTINENGTGLKQNMDAVDVAGRIGISAKRAARFHNDGAGIAVNFSAVSETIAGVRSRGVVCEDSLDAIREDYSSR